MSKENSCNLRIATMKQYLVGLGCVSLVFALTFLTPVYYICAPLGIEVCRLATGISGQNQWATFGGSLYCMMIVGFFVAWEITLIVYNGVSAHLMLSESREVPVSLLSTRPHVYIPVALLLVFFGNSIVLFGPGIVTWLGKILSLTSGDTRWLELTKLYYQYLCIPLFFIGPFLLSLFQYFPFVCADSANSRFLVVLIETLKSGARNIFALLAFLIIPASFFVLAFCLVNKCSLAVLLILPLGLRAWLALAVRSYEPTTKTKAKGELLVSCLLLIALLFMGRELLLAHMPLLFLIAYTIAWWITMLASMSWPAQHRSGEAAAKQSLVVESLTAEDLRDSFSKALSFWLRLTLVGGIFGILLAIPSLIFAFLLYSLLGCFIPPSIQSVTPVSYVWGFLGLSIPGLIVYLIVFSPAILRTALAVEKQEVGRRYFVFPDAKVLGSSILVQAIIFLAMLAAVLPGCILQARMSYVGLLLEKGYSLRNAIETSFKMTKNRKVLYRLNLYGSLLCGGFCVSFFLFLYLILPEKGSYAYGGLYSFVAIMYVVLNIVLMAWLMLQIKCFSQLDFEGTK